MRDCCFNVKHILKTFASSALEYLSACNIEEKNPEMSVGHTGSLSSVK